MELLAPVLASERPRSSIDGGRSATDARWWVLHTRPRQEKLLSETLTRTGVTAYLPLVSVRHSYAKRKVAFQVPLFPSYVFLRGGFREREQALRTNRVLNVLDVPDQDQFEREIGNVRQAISGGAAIELYPTLQVGQRCRVARGPLMGIEGTVVLLGRRCELHLSVTTLGQSAVLQLDAALVEPIND